MYTFKDFRNGSDLKFTDISSELLRVYSFAKDNGIVEVEVDSPVALHVSENGHRIFDALGGCHYIPEGWVCLSWRVKPGQPHFVK